MTFALAGIDPQTGHIGFAVATSSVCVGARCGRIGAGCVVFSQARTDPRLHNHGLRAFAAGGDALAAMQDAATSLHWRQLGVLSADGAHHFTGASCLPHCGGVTGAHSLALGNYLASADVLPAMIAGFTAATGPLTQRLMAGMLAGQAAGGEIDPLQSSALRVMGADDLVEADLRVDRSADPLADLGALLADWAPKEPAYRLRAIDPDAAPPSSEVEGHHI
jgi:uncharacterized Ntn-hydrolase superfamily protein